MIRYAQAGHSVVRLKSGDPLLFGRAGEEMDALREAAIPFQVIPGVTAAFACAAQAQIPLTDRRGGSSLLLTTGHLAQGEQRTPLGNVDDAIIALYMPGKDYASLAAELLREGWPALTPCTIVSHATQPHQQILYTQIGKLAEKTPMPAPALLLIGPRARS